MHVQLTAYAAFDIWRAWFCKNVLFLKLAKKKTKLTSLLVLLLYYTSQIFLLYKSFNIWVFGNSGIHYFQKYICFTVFHIFLLTSALVVTLRCLSVFMLLITSLLIKYTADVDVLNKLFIVSEVCRLNKLLISMT